ncbi:SLAC1 anion channel family protein [Paenibacillus montanisoli]|uniref:C4-dicarboxylate ABC transporter n=1 Tax=Paenibacillus montanisoli TaxID=2081970 RepID=A0A328U7I1_9BACL|nr:SLAC1 anion channel family protein [Paenibacillus montanisoli]RAP78042.1 C4-dicarboxylate ABC transporter [Paenibacillus montanisoli]
MSKDHLIRTTSLVQLPINLFGAVMGLSGLALAWRLSSQVFGTHAMIGDGIGILAVAVFLVLFVSYLVKAIRYTDQVKAEFNHPIAGHFFGTFTIAILLLSSVIAPYSESIGQAVWIAGTVLTLALSYTVVSRLLRGRQEAAHAVPAWLIPGVAALDIAVSGGTMPFGWAHELNLLSLAIGSFVALVFFTLIVYRLIHHDPLPLGLTPSLIILIAPFEVGFLGYTTFTGRIDNFASALFYFGLFLFAVLFVKVFRKSVPFSASWWAVSFPMAALSNAALKYADFTGSWMTKAIAVLLLVLLTAVLAVLFVRTLVILFNGKLLGLP